MPRYSQMTSEGNTGIAQSQCQRISQRQFAQGLLTIAEFIGHFASMQPCAGGRPSKRVREIVAEVEGAT